MHSRIRHLYAIAGGLLIAGLTLSTVDLRLLGAMIIGIFGGRDEGLLIDPTHLTAGLIYAHVGIVGFAVATGGAVTLSFWESRSSRWVAPTMFLTLMAVLLAISLAYFVAGDEHIPRFEQAILDLCLVVVALICVGMTLRVNANGVLVTVVEFTVIGLLLLQGVFTPVLYGLLWLLKAQGVISASASHTLSPVWISSAAAIGSMAISYWTLRRTNAKKTRMRRRHLTNVK